MIRAVLDTNILVSAMAVPHGVTGQILDQLEDQEFELVVSDYILDELGRVLVEKIGLDREFVSEKIAQFYRVATVVKPVSVDIPAIDEDDWPVIGTAVSGNANVLVSGDRKLLALKYYDDILIISARTFLDELRTND